MPYASVVIPCYNAERFVEETIKSAQAQTIQDIEIICVNDGSTDGTLDLLNQLASKDERIRVISQDNGGEGPARDAGLVAAKGQWLYFLDSDDLMEPTLLEEAIGACERDKSDIAIFRTLTLNVLTGEELPCWYSYNCDWMTQSFFSPREYPVRIFNSFQNWVHNKIFRASFVRAHGLRMQHVHRTADLLFTCRALAEASRISLVDKHLHRYRINNPQSALATSDSYPLDFYEAFVALRESLERHGTWELYHESYVNWAIHGVASNLSWARSYDGFMTIANAMLDGGLKKMDILGFPREKSDNLVSYDLVSALANKSMEEAFFTFMATYRVQLSQTEDELSLTRLKVLDNARRIGELEGSKSYRIGRTITAIPRSVRHVFKR